MMNEQHHFLKRTRVNLFTVVQRLNCDDDLWTSVRAIGPRRPAEEGPEKEEEEEEEGEEEGDWVSWASLRLTYVTLFSGREH